MVRYTVSEPFGTKLFIWYGLTPAWTYFNARPGYTAKTPIGNEKWRFLCFKRLYCNLHVILLQMIYNSIWLDTWSQSLLIQNFPYGMGADACLGILWYLMAQPGCTLKPVWEGKVTDIANQITLLQSTGNSVSNETLFVMLRCLVSKPFNTELSMQY